MPDDAFPLTNITVEEESSPRPAIGAVTRLSPLPPTTQLQSTPRARSPPAPKTQLQGISTEPTTTTTTAKTRRRTLPVTTSTRTAPTTAASGSRTVTGISTVSLRLPARRPRQPLFPPPGGPSGLPPPSRHHPIALRHDLRLHLVHLVEEEVTMTMNPMIYNKGLKFC